MPTPPDADTEHDEYAQRLDRRGLVHRQPGQPIGRPSVSHATAVGKVMLAFGGGPLPRERDLTALTDRTITDRASLEAEIAAVREQGYGTVFGEREADVNAIAAPVSGRAGALAAILGIQGPAARLEDPARLLAPLLEGAAELTRALGGRP